MGAGTSVVRISGFSWESECGCLSMRISVAVSGVLFFLVVLVLGFGELLDLLDVVNHFFPTLFRV